MEKKTVYLFFGPPGVGKGTLAQTCVNVYGWKHISTGTLCRKHIKEGTTFGRSLAELINNGFLVPDEIIIAILEDELKTLQNTTKSIILDGFPRTLPQAQLLHNLFLSSNLCYYRPAVVLFQAPDHVIAERLHKRVICSNPSCEKIYTQENAPHVCDACQNPIVHRFDDAKDKINARIDTYKEHCQHLIDFWLKNQYILCTLSSDKSAPEVFSHFRELVNVTECTL